MLCALVCVQHTNLVSEWAGGQTLGGTDQLIAILQLEIPTLQHGKHGAVLEEGLPRRAAGVGA